MPRERVVDHANHILEYLREVAEERQLHVYSDPPEVVYQHDWDKAWVTITTLDKYGKPKHDIARFQLQQMPGCCAIMTMSYVDTNPKRMTFENAVDMVCEAAKRAAFGSVALTQVVHGDRAPERHEWYSIVKLGFKMSEPFINAKSGNKVVYLTKDLGQVGHMFGFEDVIQQ